jgi:hypothetical protein
MKKRLNTDDIKTLEKVLNTDVSKVVIIPDKSERVRMPDNIAVFQRFAYLAATKLKPATNQVLMLFLALSAYENVVSMDVLSISEDLKMSGRSVLRALYELEENDIIVKIPHLSDRRRNEYFINPVAAWRGYSHNRIKALKKLAEDPAQLKLFQGDMLQGIDFTVNSILSKKTKLLSNKNFNKNENA